MPKKRIAITFEGHPSENGEIRLSDFWGRLSSFSAAIKRADRLVSGRGTPTFYFRITDLKYTSPATVSIAAYPKDPKVDFCDQAINEVFSTIQHIEKDTLHAPTDYDLLEDIKNLVAPVGISLGSLGLSSDGYDVQLSEKFKAKVDLTMAPEETHLGFIRGALEYINIHRAQKVFRIYPEVGPNKVTCYFPEDLREVAIDAVGQFVQVHGIIHYKSIARYPHQINVKKMDILPREEDLPSIFDLKGIAPDLTGGLSSEEFVQSLKDAEQY